MFGTRKAIEIPARHVDRAVQLRTLYQSQLQDVAQFVRYFEMRDRRDRPQYDLFFASNHRLGHIKMKEAMWRVDPGGTFSFSDATIPEQRVLFGADSARLLNWLRERFRGRGMVRGIDVRRFVEDETPFLKKHMTPLLQEAEERSEVMVEPLKANGEKRMARTFPDDVCLTFVEPKQ